MLMPEYWFKPSKNPYSTYQIVPANQKGWIVFSLYFLAVLLGFLIPLQFYGEKKATLIGLIPAFISSVIFLRFTRGRFQPRDPAAPQAKPAIVWGYLFSILLGLLVYFLARHFYAV